MGNMGSGYSQVQYERLIREYYQEALGTCVLPDVGIDNSLMVYSGLNSNAVLRDYSALLANVPGYVGRLGSVFGPLTTFPNAVGLGALVLSILLDLCLTGSSQTNSNPYSLLQRVFGEEKASGVRDTISEYVNRHRMFLNDEQGLLMNLNRMEEELSSKLTILKNSMVEDGQMSTRSFKFWVNGAYFHLQMLIHQARLRRQHSQIGVNIATVQNKIRWYLFDLDSLLEKYKTYKMSTTSGYPWQSLLCNPNSAGLYIRKCYIQNDETQCRVYRKKELCSDGCIASELIRGFTDTVFSNYDQITSLRTHFMNVQNNLQAQINQHDAFTLPIL